MTLPRKRNIFALFVSVALIGLYFYLWNHYALNIPKWDDHPLKGVVADFEKSTTLSEQFNIVFKQHNEHRIVLTRIVAIIDYELFGELNFKHLMFFGNLALLIIWWLITRFFKQTIAPVWYAIPIVTLWFSMAFWENAFWGMAAIQNFWVVAFALLCFWILRRNDGYWWWAMPVAFMAFFTSGNGILVLPISFLILLIQKQYQKSIVWVVFSIMIAVLYFQILDYHRPPQEFLVPTNIKTIFRGFMLMAGSIVEGLPFGSNTTKLPLYNGWLTTFVSLSLILYVLRNLVKKQSELNHYDYFYLGGTLFALLSIALVCYSRLGSGTEVMLNSRYKIYSALLFSFNIAYLTIFVNQKFRDSLTITFLIGASFLYISNQHYHLYDTINFRKFQISAAFNWKSYPNPNKPTQFLYNRPKLFTDDMVFNQTDTLGLTVKEKLEWKFDNYLQTDLRDGGRYLVLVGNESHLVPFVAPRKHSFRNLLNYNRFFEKGLNLKLNQVEFESGNYVVFQLIYSDNHIEIKKDSRVLIQNKARTIQKVNW